MAEATAPAFTLDKGIYFPQLNTQFVISKNPTYDYYSTNSGMYPKNPGSGGGGGGGGGDDPSEEIQGLKQKVAAVEQNLSSMQDKQATAASEALSILKDIKPYDEINAVEDIVTNQLILSSSQETILGAMNN